MESQPSSLSAKTLSVRDKCFACGALTIELVAYLFSPRLRET